MCLHYSEESIQWLLSQTLMQHGLWVKWGYLWGSTHGIPQETGNSFSETFIWFSGSTDRLQRSYVVLGQCWVRDDLHEMPTYSCCRAWWGRICWLIAAALFPGGRGRADMWCVCLSMYDWKHLASNAMLSDGQLPNLLLNQSQSLEWMPMGPSIPNCVF